MATGRRTRLKIVETAPDLGEVAPPRPRSLGETLRAERERRNWKIPDLAQHLKIRRVHLEAIEAGRFNALPGPTYAVQFVRSYADVLGLDSGEMVRRFRDEVEGLDRRLELNFPQPLAESRLPAGIVVLVSVVIAGLGYGAWTQFNQGARVALPRVEAVPQQLVERLPPAPPIAAAPAPEIVVLPTGTERQAAPTPAAPPAAEVPQPAPPAAVVTVPPVPAPPVIVAAPPASVTAPPAPAPAPISVAPSAPQETPAPPPPAAMLPTPAPLAPAGDGPRTFGDVGGNGRVTVHAQADSWVQVREPGGTVVFMRILRSGETYQSPARADLLLTTGSAGALEIRVDGKPVPTIGRVGVVKRDVVLDPQRLVAGTAAPPDPPMRATPQAVPQPAPAAPVGGG